MPRVYIPSNMRTLTGHDIVDVTATNVREAIDELEQRFPGVKAALCAHGRLMPGISVVVDGRIGTLGLWQPLSEDAEVHFVPALGGG